MATQKTPHWYNDHELFLHGLVRSNYVTAITDWFMGFAGKWAELVLYGTVLYSCAELYPGVHLPDGLSLGVFLVQLGALDIGGLSLAKLAKQAKEDGDATGAANAETLSKWLIGIMLVGVVTVGLERVLPVALPSWVMVSINVILVVARSIAAVLYGRVVHDLKQETTMHQQADFTTELNEKFSQELTAALDLVRQEFRAQASEVSQMFSNQFSELTRSLENQDGQVATIQDALNTHEQTLTGLATLPGIVDRHERSMRQALADMRSNIELSAASKPKLSLVAGQGNTEKLTTDEGELTNRKFIEDHLSKHPGDRNVDVIEAGSKQGLTISQSQVSQIRKALKEQTA